MACMALTFENSPNTLFWPNNEYVICMLLLLIVSNSTVPKLSDARYVLASVADSSCYRGDPGPLPFAEVLASSELLFQHG